MGPATDRAGVYRGADRTAQRSHGTPNGQLHRTRSLSAEDITTLRGIPITTVARTLADLAAVLNTDQLERAVNQAEVLQLLDVNAVHAAIGRAPGRRGAKRLQVMLSAPSAGPTESEMEERFLALCRRGGLPTPRLNRSLWIGGREIRPDALWPAHGLAVELDGGAVHRTAKAFEDDRRRDAALAAQGYVVVRFTWQRVTHDGGAVLDELRQILALRSSEAA
jgi:very-short-patch-repair endonuclease